MRSLRSKRPGAEASLGLRRRAKRPVRLRVVLDGLMFREPISFHETSNETNGPDSLSRAYRRLGRRRPHAKRTPLTTKYRASGIR